MTNYKRILKNIDADNEGEYLKALREYYRQNYNSGHSDECFLVWIEGLLAKHCEYFPE